MKKALFIVLLSIFIPIAVFPQQAAEPAWVKNIPMDKVIEWRRHLHQYPELTFNEVNTSNYVADLLKSFGNIEIVRPTKTSVLGILRGGHPGRTVAFRADLDALPVPEETSLPFTSKVEGVSHACGHDAHTAMLLGTAATLSQMRSDIHGTVYFVFQHAEEQHPGGAQEIIKTGALKGIEAIFGMHIFTGHKAGHIGILPKGAASTASDGFYLVIQGKGSHGSMPHLAIDPVVIGSEIVLALQTVVSRNVAPGDWGVITVGMFRAGEVANVIPEKAELAATIRTIKETTRKLIAERVKAIIDNIVKANGASYNLDYVFSTPAIENDPALVDLAKASAEKILGSDLVDDEPRMSASEDFAKYKEIAPECLILLGAGSGPMNHNPGFNIDESSLINGIKTQIQIILDYLNRP